MSALLDLVGMGEEKKRTFLRVNPKTGETLGVFSSSSPLGAAKKAVRKSFGKKSKGKKMAGKQKTVYMRETGTKKLFKYVGQLKRLKKPKVVVLSDGTEISYKYTTKVKSKGIVQTGGTNN